MTSMAETATETVVINAPAEQVWEVVTALEHYPEWVKVIKDVVVRARDDQQRPLEVEFRASAFGRSTHYTLGYDYSRAPDALSWHLIKGDIQRAIDGTYTFTENSDGTTTVVYDLAIELAMVLPAFVKRRAEVRILNTLRELKARVEGPPT